MKVDEYQKASARTLNDKPDFELTNDQLMTIWCLTGLVGEVGELCEAVIFSESFSVKNDKDWFEKVLKIKKEIGDNFWYLAGICTKQRLSLSEIVNNSFGEDVWTPITIEVKQLQYVYSLRNLLLAVCRISENIKKGIFHQHGINQVDLRRDIKAIYLTLKIIAENFGLDIFEIMQDNIDKLLIRFSKGFNSQDSIKRVDVK